GAAHSSNVMQHVSNINKMIIARIASPLLFIIFIGCQSSTTDTTFKPTSFAEDVKTLKLEQVFDSPDRNNFLGIFYDETKSLSGNKIVKLYSTDSISIDECYYGAHPLEVDHWTDSGIVFMAGVFSHHGDSLARKRYLDWSVDGETILGRYNVKYKKDYNFDFNVRSK